MTTTLADLIAQQRPNGVTAIINGREAVTLGQTEGGLIEACYDGTVQQFEPGLAVTEVTEPDRQVGVLRHALAVVHQRSRGTQREFQEVLERIRTYAIEKHQSGVICRGGLDDFLSEFNMPEYGA